MHLDAPGQRHGQQHVSETAKPAVVKQDKSSRGSIDTTKTCSDPQRVGSSGGERPIGAAKGKQTKTMASCHSPPPRVSIPRPPPPECHQVEGRFQIRPQQYTVARSIIEAPTDDPGPVVQLNMGEGKTRVILPMLLLHWAERGDALTRLHVLSPLLTEAVGYLRAHLCASALNLRVLQLPFQRDVALTPARVAAMRACLEHARRAGAVLCVAPEHRLSLLLKTQVCDGAQGFSLKRGTLNHVKSRFTTF